MTKKPLRQQDPGALKNTAAHSDMAVQNTKSIPMDDEIVSSAAFVRFITQHTLHLTRYFLSRRMQLEDAQDLAQETILTMWRKRHESMPPHVRFLFGIARRILFAFLRKHKASALSDEVKESDCRAEAKALEDIEERPPSSAASPRDETISLLKALSQNQGKVFQLRFIEGCSRRQTAEKLGMSRRSVETHELRAIAALQEIMGRKMR